MKSGVVFSIVFCSLVSVVISNSTAETTRTDQQTLETVIVTALEYNTTGTPAPSSGSETINDTTFVTEWRTVNATDMAEIATETDTIYLLCGVILMVLVFAVLISAYTYKQYDDRQTRRKNALLCNVEGEYYIDDGTTNPDLCRDFGIQVDLDSDDDGMENTKSAVI